MRLESVFALSFQAGSVSAPATRGYAVLPESSWDKVGGIQGSRVVFSGEAPVSTVEAVVQKGSADRAGLARLLTHSARQVAEKAGCAAPARTGVPALAAPESLRKTDARNACGLKGFSLPEEAVPTDRAEPALKGTFQNFLDAAADTYSCPRVDLP
ncbi:hypothetical protein DMH02_023280 [Streptomyces sp. WAC 00631]|uniref:hypothetical protein n=1 Tax=unclassified Streptomyces TaxID=2593676 RepID=UPI000F7801A0|nr:MULTISPECIES: hypothetical protein [unclassified Streptomyces]MCC5036044.1 hypothetical protein [Streptomyces sp. WAC 00631]MCC9738934.1 hypothetical protein [Streptomyces sp. MNU89]